MLCVGRGSPPLAREQLFSFIRSGPSCRITPARAGTTCDRQFLHRQHRDHPRSRGNNPYTECKDIEISGSPPLAREQLCTGNWLKRSTGITPARAGTTGILKSHSVLIRDHPRSRGNNFYVSALVGVDIGSPPLAREQREYNRQSRKSSGITPARAGTTLSLCVFALFFRDHPRSRGNNH